MVLIVLALIVCAYMAWNIGANDVAKAMGTSVGSRALTLKQAVVIAAVFEFCGAFFAGDAVTDTVRKGSRGWFLRPHGRLLFHKTSLLDLLRR